jgi:hypothetical protein
MRQLPDLVAFRPQKAAIKITVWERRHKRTRWHYVTVFVLSYRRIATMSADRCIIGGM